MKSDAETGEKQPGTMFGNTWRCENTTIYIPQMHLYKTIGTLLEPEHRQLESEQNLP